MCGIIGFYTDKESASDEEKELIEELAFQSKIRGLHSFGITYKLNAFVTHKEFNLIKLQSIMNSENYKQLIFHNRYATSGNYLMPKNNQPINIGAQSLVFNGVISQATKEENEKTYEIKMETDNDGEIFLRQNDKEKFIRENNFSFAGLWFDGDLFFIRNKNRPAYFYSTKQSVFIASTKDIFKRSGINNVQQLPCNEKIKVSDYVNKR